MDECSLLSASVELGCSDGMYQLGKRYEEGRGVPVDVAKAVELYEKAAEAGYPEAMLEMAYRYYNGDGVPADKEVATELFVESSEKFMDDGEYMVAVEHHCPLSRIKDVTSRDWTDESVRRAFWRNLAPIQLSGEEGYLSDMDDPGARYCVGMCILG